MKVQVVCPNCHKILSFNEVPGWQDKLIECPNCHFKAKASIYQSGSFAKGGMGSDDCATEIVGANSNAAHQDTEIGVIKEVSTGRAFQLKMGTNVLGRIAKSGKADMMINQDPYMSRSHLRIDVIQTASGIEHRLVEIDSKNVIVLNGRPIQRKDILKLNYGDRMKLGQTEVIFDHARPDDDEPTQLL